MYEIQIRVETLKIEEWLERYYDPDKFLPLCKECLDYCRNWSCPPEIPNIQELVKNYHFVQVIGIKIVYEEWVRKAAAVSTKCEEELRQLTYGTAKKRLLQTLLALESVIEGSLAIMAGKCELCEQCSRIEGKDCRYPNRLRYSYSGLGFDLGRIASELLEMPLLWQNDGLPEYNVAIAAFLHQ